MSRAQLALFFYEQEPENDPRYCCYLWVARGPLVPENCPETPATLTLYQLVFASKDILPGYGIIYKVISFLFSYEIFMLYYIITVTAKLPPSTSLSLAYFVLSLLVSYLGEKNLNKFTSSLKACF